MRVFMATAPCDMRRQFDGLAALVRSGMSRDPKSGDLYVFRNRRGDLLKALFFDRHGYCMLAKRLSSGRFRYWPARGDSIQHELLAHELQVLVMTGDPSATRASPAWRPVTPTQVAAPP